MSKEMRKQINNNIEESISGKLLLTKLNKMRKLPSFEYKKMIFHNVKDNLFQTDRFEDKLIYKFENGKYHLVKDERLSSVIGTDEVSRNPNSMCNNDYWWK